MASISVQHNSTNLISGYKNKAICLSAIVHILLLGFLIWIDHHETKHPNIAAITVQFIAAKQNQMVASQKSESSENYNKEKIESQQKRIISSSQTDKMKTNKMEEKVDSGIEDNKLTKGLQASTASSPSSMTESAFKVTREAIPHYPNHLKSRGQEGFVRISLVIEPNGKVREHKLLEHDGSPLFVRMTIRSLKQLRFNPIGGNQLRHLKRLYRFKINQSRIANQEAIDEKI